MLYNLPDIFAVKRYRPDITDLFPELETYKHIAVLVSVSRNTNGTWSLNVIENPESIIDESIILASYDDKWFNNTIKSIDVQSDIVRNIKLKFNNCIIVHPSGVIPVLKMSDPCVTLSDEFYYLNRESSRSFRFECLVVNSYKNPNNDNFDVVLNKHENCPVFMIPLTKENIRITSCGHAISSGVERWIEEKGTCPMCREPQNLESLCSYKF